MKLLLIDNRVPDIETIISAVNETTACIVFNYYHDTQETLLSKIRFLNKRNRVIRDNFYYEPPPVPVITDLSNCHTCDASGNPKQYISSEDIALKAMEYATSSESAMSDSNILPPTPWTISPNQNTGPCPVFFQRVQPIMVADASGTTVLYHEPLPVLVSELDEIYETFKTIPYESSPYVYDNSSVSYTTFSTVGIIQHSYSVESDSYTFLQMLSNAVLKNVTADDPTLQTWEEPFISTITTLLTRHQMQTLDLMACALYSDPNWKYVIDELQTRLAINIRASLDNTGAASMGGNWILESDSANLKDVYFTDAIDGWSYLLATITDTRFYTMAFNNSMYLTYPGSSTAVNVGTGDFTFETWYYETSKQTGSTIFDKGAYNYTWQIRNPNGTNDGLSFTNNNWNGGSNWLYANTAVVPVAQWSHLAITRAGNIFKFYINGTLMQTMTNTSNSTLNNNGSNFSIGLQSPDNCLCNKLKAGTRLYDARMWNVCRTDTQIKQYRNRIVPANTTGLVANYGLTFPTSTAATAATTISDRTSNAINMNFVSYTNTWSNDIPVPNIGFYIENNYLQDVITEPSNLVAQYRFDSNALDSSPNNNTLTNVSSVTFNTSEYKHGTAAASFNGSNYFQIANDGRFSPDNFTVACWIKPVAGTGYQTIAACRNSPSPLSGWIIYISENNLEFWTGSGSNWSGPGVTLFSGFGNLNSWVHLCFTLNKSTGSLVVYINGNLTTTVSRTYANNTLNNLRIGAGANESTAEYIVRNGTLIDDFRFYNQVLTSSEVTAISRVATKFAVNYGDLTSTDFSGVNFTGVNFTSTTLTGSNFTNCNFTNATLVNVTVDSSTNFTGANFTGITSSGITGAPILSADYIMSSGAIVPTLPAPTIGALATIPTKILGTDVSFNLVNPSSNSSGAFTYSSSNTTVARVLSTRKVWTMTRTSSSLGNFNLKVTANNNDIAFHIDFRSDRVILAYYNSAVGGWPVISSPVFDFHNLPLPTVFTVAFDTNNFTVTYGPSNSVLTFPNYLNVASLAGISDTVTFNSNVIGSATVQTVQAHATILQAGTSTITATQASDGTYRSASVSTTLTVNAIVPTFGPFTLGPKSGSYVLADASFSLTAPTSDSSGAFSYTSDNLAVAVIRSTYTTSNLLARYDASVASGYTLNSGSNVTQWNDLTGNGYHFNVVWGGSPTLSTINSIQAMEFNSGKGLYRTNVPLNTDVTVFMVIRYSSLIGTWGNFMHHGDHDFDWSMRKSELSSPYGKIGFHTNNDNTTVMTSLVDGMAYILIGRLNISGSIDYWAYPQTGTVFELRNVPMFKSIVSGNKTMYVGRSDTNEACNGRIGEILYYNSAISNADISTNLIYLQNKWFNGVNTTGPGVSVILVSSGTANITATQDASGSYSARSVSSLLTVSNVITPTLGTFTVPSTKFYGDASFSISLRPTSDSSGAITYTSITLDTSNNALSFDGANDYVSTMANITSLSTANFTIETWIKTSGTGMGLVSCSDRDSTWETGEKAFYIDSSGNPTFVGFGNGYIKSTLAVNDGTWHHVAVVWAYSGSGTTGTGKIYVDGVERTNAGTTNYNAINANFGFFSFGMPNYESNEAPNFFNGSMCELRIWNVARTRLQIVDTMTARSISASSFTGLVAYYPMNIGTAGGSNSALTTLYDSTSNAYNGTLTNFALSGTTSNYVTGPIQTGVASIDASGNTITVYGVGNVAFVATQAALGQFSSATKTSNTLMVSRGTPSLGTLTLGPKSGSYVLADASFSLTAPTSNSSGAFTYTSDNSGVATISGTSVTLVAVGTANITATQAASVSYLTSSVSTTLTVNGILPTFGTFTLGPKSGSYVLADASFSLTAPTSDSSGAFSYTSDNSGVATVTNSVSALYSITNPAIPTLSLTNFPILGAMPTWEMSIRFTVTGGSGNWRALVGDMYNTVNTGRGWAVYVSDENGVFFSWNNLFWRALPGSVSFNTEYILKVTRTPTSLTMLLTTVSSGATQTAVNTAMSDTSAYVMSVNGPVTIGGWINVSGENFPGTIAYVTVTNPNSGVTTNTTSNLLARYDASVAASGYTLSGSNVTQWNDLTGNGYHLTANGTGPTATTINSVAALDFNSGLGLTRASVPLSTSVTVFMAITYRSTLINVGGNFMHHGSRDTDLSIERYFNTSQIQFTTDSQHPAPTIITVANNTNYILVGRLNGTSREFWTYSDTVAPVYITGSSSALVAGNKTLYVGKSDSGSEACNSSIGEILYYNASLSNADVSANILYLQNKWLYSRYASYIPRVTLVSSGTANITATQAASGNYLSKSVSSLLRVGLDPTFGTFTLGPKAGAYLITDVSFSLTAPTSDSSGAFSYTSDNSGVATIVTQSFTSSNLVARYDASVASSYTLSGSNVTQWNDLTGNGYHLTVNGTGPTLTNINSITALNFASSRGLVTSAVPKTKMVTVFIVIKYSSNISGYGTYIQHGNRDWDWSIRNSNTTSNLVINTSGDNNSPALGVENGLNYIFVARLNNTSRELWRYSDTPTTTQILSTNNMNNVTGGTFNGGQYQSNLVVAYAGNLEGWDESGASTIIVVDIANVYGSATNTPNYVSMFWTTSTITQTTAVSDSNVLNASYTVSYKAGPAVYQIASQATQANASDGIVFEVLRANNTVLATSTYFPGAWAGFPTLTANSFAYIGDGTGNVRIRIKSLSQSVDRFGGCVDDVSITRNSYYAIASGNTNSTMTTHGFTNNIYVGKSEIGEPSEGIIGEILYYNTALSDANINSTLAYLQNKWFTRITPIYVNLVAAGTANITATQDVCGNYLSKSVSSLLTVANLITPTLGTFTVPSTRFYGDASFNISLRPTSDSSGAITYTSSNTSVATIDASGNWITLVGAGDVSFNATQAALGQFSSGTKTSNTLSVSIGTPTLSASTFAVPTPKIYGDASFAILTRPTSNSTGAITYTSSNTNVATIDASGNWITLVSAGDVSFNATQAAVPNQFNSATKTSNTLSVSIGTPTLSASTFAVSGTKAYGDASFAILTRPTSNSTGAITYTSSNTNVATIDASGNWITLVSAGDVSFNATQAAVPNQFNSATKTSNTLAVSIGTPTLSASTFAVPTPKAYGDASFAILTRPTSNSTGAITYTSSNTNVATIDASGNRITLVSAGDVSFNATQAAVPNQFSSATKTSNTLSVSIGTPTLSASTFAVPTPKAYGDASFAILTRPTSNSSGAITYTSSNPGVATIDASGNWITLVSAGDVSFNAAQAAVPNQFNSATKTSNTLSVSIGTPTLSASTFAVPTPKIYGDASFAITTRPTSNSSGAITYTSSNINVATIDASGNRITIQGAGDVSFNALQAAVAGQFNSATKTSNTLTVSRATPAYQPISQVSKTFGVDVSFSLSAIMVGASSSNGAYTFSSSGATATSTTILSTDNMNNVTGTLTNTQYQSNLKLGVGGDLVGWSESGLNHFVDLANTAGQTNTPNYAIMFWDTYTITQTTAVSNSNTLNTIYTVNFKAGPAVYFEPSQTTQATASDGIVFEVLRANNTVLATNTYLPGAWAGYPTLTSSSFTYTGDGTGNIRVRIKPVASGTGRFSGCVDDVVISSSSTVARYISISGDVATILGYTPSAITIDASQAATANYNVGNTTFNLLVARGTPSYQAISQVTKTVGIDASFSLSAIMTGISSSDGSYTFSSASDAISISGGIATINAYTPSAVTVTATQNEGLNYNAASTTFSLLISRRTPSLSSATFTVPSSKAYGDASFAIDIRPVSDSSGVITYSSSNTSVATIDASGNFITIVGMGDVSFNATQAETPLYNTATRTSNTLSVSIGTPTLSASTFAVPTPKIYGDASFAITTRPTSNSSGAITYTSSNINVATIDASGNRITIQGAGDVSFNALQAAVAGQFNSATKTSNTLTVSRATPAYQPISQVSKTFGVDVSFSLSSIMVGASTSNGAYTFSSSGPASASTTILSTDNMNSITSQRFTAGQYQTGLKVANVGNLVGWDKLGANAIHVVDIANIVGQSNTPNYVTMFWADNVITQTTAVSNSNTLNTIYTVNYKAGPAVYEIPGHATQATTSDGIVFEVLRANNTVLAASTYLPGAWAGYLTLTPNSFTYTGDGTGNIRLRIKTVSSSINRFGGCVDDVVISSPTVYVSISGDVATILEYPSSAITITASQAATANYNVGNTTFNLLIARGTPSYQIIPQVTKTVNDVSFSLSAIMTGISSSDGSYTFSSASDAISISGGIATINAYTPSAVTVTASQNEGLNYNPGSTTFSLLIARGTSSLSSATFTVPSSKAYGDASFAIDIRPVSDSSGVITYSSSNTSVATIDASGNFITIVGMGDVSFNATQAETPLYNTATRTSNTLSVSKATINPTFVNPPTTKNVTDAAFTVVATSARPGAVTYSSSNTARATVDSSSGLVTLKGVGTVTITASQASTDLYNTSTATCSIVIASAGTTLQGQTISSNASFASVDLSGASLVGTTVSGVSFSNANLSNVNFSGAVITGTNFSNANISGATNLPAFSTVQKLQLLKNINNAGVGAIQFNAPISGADINSLLATPNTEVAAATFTVKVPTAVDASANKIVTVSSQDIAGNKSIYIPVNVNETVKINNSIYSFNGTNLLDASGNVVTFLITQNTPFKIYAGSIVALNIQDTLNRITIVGEGLYTILYDILQPK